MFEIADLENDSGQEKSYMETKTLYLDTPNFPYGTFSLFKILIKVYLFFKTVS